MKNVLPEAHLEHVHVLEKHTVEFEEFCRRNNIPFEIQSRSCDESVYWIRAGIDYADAQIMVYKMGWHSGVEDGFDVNRAIRELAFTYFYWAPEYEYELTLHGRNIDEDTFFRTLW